MSADFERQKNIQASAITFGFAGMLLILFFIVKWHLPTKDLAPAEDYIEIMFNEEDINLGNNDVGSGNIQPIVTGTPSEAAVAATPAMSAPAQEEASRDIETDDRSDGPPVARPVNPRPDAQRVNTQTRTNAPVTPTPQPVTPPAPRLRAGAQMTSARGSGNGGNTDVPGYNRPGNEGPGDGNGDKGSQNGNPNGRNYAPRNLTTRIYNMPPQNFQDDFNEGGSIALDIQVDANGRLISASYSVAGSTLPKSSKQYSIALRRAQEINYPKYDGGFKQRIIMNFKVT